MFDYTQIDQARELIEAYDHPIGSRPEILAQINKLGRDYLNEKTIDKSMMASALLVNFSLAALVDLCKEEDGGPYHAAPGRIVDAVVEVRDILKRGVAMTEALLPRLEEADPGQPAPKLDA